MGGTAAAQTEWVSETSVVCKMSGGAFGSLSVAVTTGERVGTVSEAVSYDVGVGSSVAVANEGGAGGRSVSVSGAELATRR